MDASGGCRPPCMEGSKRSDCRIPTCHDGPFNQPTDIGRCPLWVNEKMFQSGARSAPRSDLSPANPGSEWRAGSAEPGSPATTAVHHPADGRTPPQPPRERALESTGRARAGPPCELDATRADQRQRTRREGRVLEVECRAVLSRRGVAWRREPRGRRARERALWAPAGWSS